MARRDEADLAVAQRVHEIQVFLARDAENVSDMGSFQAANEQVGAAIFP
jgi:hypothetical protein